MLGLQRYVRILRLFDEKHDEWTIADMSAALSAPPSTIYRAVREMVGSDLLEAAGEAQYRLGPCFIEYARLTQVADPLYVTGMSVLRDVAAQARVPCVAVLARLYNEKVMCIADVASPIGTVRTSYERGRPRPLTRGATSKAILTQLPRRRLSRLLGPVQASDQEAVAARHELLEELAAIRRRGFSVTRGEVDAGLVGIAAPVAIASRGLLGSLSLVVEAAQIDGAIERRLALLTVSTASLLVEDLSSLSRRTAIRAVS